MHARGPALITLGVGQIFFGRLSKEPGRFHVVSLVERLGLSFRKCPEWVESGLG